MSATAATTPVKAKPASEQVPKIHRMIGRLSAMAGASLTLQLTGWAADCHALQEQRDQLARQAIQAEVQLLHSLRQRICPQQEQLASTATDDGKEALDLSVYIRCRQEAEAALQKSHPVLYANQHGFTHYTPDGARWARQADALLEAMKQQECP